MNHCEQRELARVKERLEGIPADVVFKRSIRATSDVAPFVRTLHDIVMYFRARRHIDILEIGVRRGVSTKFMLDGLLNREGNGYGTGHLYSMDNVERDMRVMGGSEEMRKNWTFILGDSKELPWTKELDILWIDGDHSYEGAKADYENYEPFVKPGGLILMHDVSHPNFGVKDFWPEVTYPKSVLTLNPSGLGIINKPL